MRKVLLVTGGSRGIGAATCILAAQKGWAVAVNYTANSKAADEVVAEIKKTGGEAMSVQADVANEEQVLAMFEKVRSTLGPLQGLVNNAGVVDVSARLDQMSMARWRRMFDINVLGSMLCAREAIRQMSTLHGGKGGRIGVVQAVVDAVGGLQRIQVQRGQLRSGENIMHGRGLWRPSGRGS